MKYKNNTQFQHSETDRIGVLITNLGTPDKPETGALRRYLREFLSDPRVVEFPRFAWWLVLNLIILRIRPRRSALSYKTVWTEQGSPLAIHTEDQADKLAEKLQSDWGDNLVVDWAMRYGNPSIASKLEQFNAKGVRKLLLLPLYPQYSASTTASTFDALAKDFTRRRWIPELRFVTSYHDHPGYINALCQSIESFWQEHGRAKKILFSFHGVPTRYLHNGDPYHCQCLKTARLAAEKLNLKIEEYEVCFQSRFGREPWLKPYTDETLKSLPKKGVKDVQVVCPGFSADCLETLEEIEEENKNYFLEAGGEKYTYIPALNSEENHISFLYSLINENLCNWHKPENELAKRSKLAEQCPHNRKS